MSGTAVSAAMDTHDALTARNALESPLLRLPAELRNMIYKLVIGGHCIHICHFYACTLCRGESFRPVIHRPRDCVAITKTCRQINGETTLLPIALNTFCGYRIDDVQVTLEKRLSQTQAASVKSIFVMTYPTFPIKEFIEFRGLKKVMLASAYQGPWRDLPFERSFDRQRETTFGFASHVEVIYVKGREFQGVCSGWYRAKGRRIGEEYEPFLLNGPFYPTQ